MDTVQALTNEAGTLVQETVSVTGGQLVSKYGKKWSYTAKGAANAVITGTVEELGGRKFANGAITGAFSMMFNDVMHDVQAKRKSLAASAKREQKNNDKWVTKNGQRYCNVFAQDMIRENGIAPHEDRYLPAGTGVIQMLLYRDGKL